MWKGGSKITWYEHPEFGSYIFNPSPFNSSGYVFSGLNTSYLDIYSSKQTRNITKFRSMDFEPSVSPDEKALVFTSDRISNSDIYTNERPLSDRQAIENIKEWNFTERGINYNTYRDHNIDIFTSDIDGSNTIRLTSARALDYQPDWSSDGHWIVFSSLRHNNSEIFKIRADGTDLERLTNNKYNDDQPSWSPETNLIAFVSDRSGSKNIYVMDAMGKNQTQITSSLSGLSSPTWIKCKKGIFKKVGTTCP
jgi:TolB protein